MNAEESLFPDRPIEPAPHRPARPELATWSDGREERLRRGSHVGIVLPCYNEEGNVDELYKRLTKVFEGLPQPRPTARSRR